MFIVLVYVKTIILHIIIIIKICFFPVVSYPIQLKININRWEINITEKNIINYFRPITMLVAGLWEGGIGHGG